ncbi:MAG: AMP-binding protein, partial [Firmicutes bacterium]|nr:AMP-binding protein [Bacillota bacterium]
GKHIGIMGENSYQWEMTYMAVIGGVGVVVPVDKELGEEELTYVLKAGKVEALFVSKRYLKKMMNIMAGGETSLRLLICMNAEEVPEGILTWKGLIEKGKAYLAEGRTEFVDAVVERDTMSVLLFTSGTTGLAKGVMISHGNLVTNLMVSPTLMNVQEDDIFFSVLPVHHTYECTCGFLMPLYKGASIAICEGLKYIVKNLGEVKPTLFLGVPLLFETLYKRIWGTAKKTGKDGLMRTVLKVNKVTKKIGLDLVPKLLKSVTDVFGGRMRVMICGGAAIDPAILNFLGDLGFIALQGYGLTECAPLATLNPDIDPIPTSCGHVMPTMEYKIDHADPETGIGEICVKGGNVMLGYYENPEATAEVLKDGFYHTGDLGYMDDKGFIYITGRKKNVIITKNGKNVFPEELEYLLSLIPYVDESLVYEGEANSGEDTTIVAVIRINEEAVAEVLGEDPVDEQIKALLWKEIDKTNEGLPMYKKIKKIGVRHAEFEKTSSKKIRRNVLANRDCI